MSLAINSIFCVGRNYQAHAAELGNAVPDKPMIFIKNSNCLQKIDQSEIAWNNDLVHYEAELVVRIGRDLKIADQVDLGVFSHFTLGLDLTKRDLQMAAKQNGLPWFAAKCFAGSALIGSWLEWDPRRDLSELQFQFQLNGATQQIGRLENMIFNLPTVLHHLLQSIPLRQGDIIFTGTPEGVGPIKKGDKITLAFPVLGHSWQATIG